MKKENHPFKVPRGVCPACLGDRGQIIADYVDLDSGKYYPFFWSDCPACQGSGDSYGQYFPWNKKQ